MPEFQVAGPGLTATVREGVGGKITSLLDSAGRQWLAQPDPALDVVPGADFVRGEMSGWDECAPSVNACTVGGFPIPDHGDLWATRWDTMSHDGDRVEMRATGSSMPYELRRTVAASDRGLRLDYEARSLGGDLPFLWLAHPQFVAPVGSFVRLPGEVTTVVDVLGERDRVVPWTRELATADSLAEGGCRKLYVEPALRAREASLVLEDGSSLTLSWTGCDYLGLWFDRAAFSRESVIALEPSTGYRDSLAWAIESGRASLLTPADPLRWSLWLEVSLAI